MQELGYKPAQIREWWAQVGGDFHRDARGARRDVKPLTGEQLARFMRLALWTVTTVSPTAVPTPKEQPERSSRAPVGAPSDGGPVTGSLPPSGSAAGAPTGTLVDELPAWADEH